MKKSTLKKLSLLTVLLLLFTLLAACGSAGQTGAGLQNETGPAAELPDQNGSYTSAEDVSAYLIAYGQLTDEISPVAGTVPIIRVGDLTMSIN